MELHEHSRSILSEELYRQAANEHFNYAISFAVNGLPCGSGTLVTIDSFFGILTAAHVIRAILKAQGEDFAVICADHLHSVFVQKEYIEPFEIEMSGLDEDSGPDIAFIRLLDKVLISTLKGKRSFYPLSSSWCPAFDAMRPKAHGVFSLVGAPEELASEKGERGTSTHILHSVQFAGMAVVFEEAERKGFDYLKVVVATGRENYPSNFGGVSGGGLWHIPLSMNPNIGADSVSYEAPELVGVAFFQSEPREGAREITCHGARSIQNLIQKVRTYP
jgi:hypothetical protein